MIRRTAPLVLALFLLLLTALTLFAVPEKGRAGSGKDYVSIRKITPRTGADLLAPCQFPYYIELEYRVASIPKAELSLGIYRQAPGSPRRNLVKPVTRTLAKGKGTLKINSPYISITPGKADERVLVIASLKKPGGGELAYSESFNFLQGRMKARLSSLAPTADTLQLLNYSPRETAKLYSGQNQPFTFKLSYSLKSKKICFLNIEFGEADQVGLGMCWRALVAPLQQGMGILEVETEPIFFPAALEGKSMGVAMLYRLEPLGGTQMILYIRSYKFSSPGLP